MNKHNTISMFDMIGFTAVCQDETGVEQQGVVSMVHHSQGAYLIHVNFDNGKSQAFVGPFIDDLKFLDSSGAQVKPV